MDEVEALAGGDTSEDPSVDETAVKGSDERTVPYSRFAAVSKQRRDLERSAAEALRDAETARKRIAELEAERAAEQRAVLVAKVVKDVGLPDGMAARLVGDDEGSLKADAEALLASLGGRKSAPDIDSRQGSGSAAAAPTFTRSQLRDPEFYQKHRDAIMSAFANGRIVED